MTSSQTRFIASVTSSAACRATYSVNAAATNSLRELRSRRLSCSTLLNSSLGIETASLIPRVLPVVRFDLRGTDTRPRRRGSRRSRTKSCYAFDSVPLSRQPLRFSSRLVARHCDKRAAGAGASGPSIRPKWCRVDIPLAHRGPGIWGQGDSSPELSRARMIGHSRSRRLSSESSLHGARRPLRINSSLIRPLLWLISDGTIEILEEYKL